MSRPDSILEKGLKNHIDSGKDKQNGFGYNEFVRMMNSRKRPSYRSVGAIFNRDAQTIRYWWSIYQFEKRAGVR